MPPPAIAKRAVAGPYTLVSGGKSYPLLKCNACGETPPLKSNAGIAEEVARLSAYLTTETLHCPNTSCPNHVIPVGTPKAYRSYGTNAHGSKRLQCCECGKTFIGSSKPAKGQHDTHLNREIFNLLVNKVPLSRIVKMTGASWSTLYNRIGFIHRQCLAFAARRERRLKTMPLRRLYLAIDAQDYLVNWTERKDKRNVVLKAVTASDNRTGYVFCNALNFDETADRDRIEADASLINDSARMPPHRKYARFWTQGDYADSVRKSAANRRAVSGSLQTDIANTYDETSLREDVESFDEKTREESLPSRGMQIHSEYTMIAMFHHLKNMIGNCGKWRFLLDQESGIRAACLGTFRDLILKREAEAFYVRIDKDLVQEEKRRCVRDARDRFDATAAFHPTLDESGVRLLMIKQEIANQKVLGGYGDRWVSMPLPSMSEPRKAVCWLTPHNDFKSPDGTPDEDHVAWLHNKVSLHSVDTFFMKTRRSLAMCERPIRSSGNHGRIWNAYQAYNPVVLKRLLEIFRVYHNFADLPQTGKKAERSTPAMRLGLADAVLDLNDIIYFR